MSDGHRKGEADAGAASDPGRGVDPVAQAVNEVAAKEAAQAAAEQAVARAAMAQNYAHPFVLQSQDEKGQRVTKPALFFIPQDLTEGEAFAMMGELWKAARQISVEAEAKGQSALQKAGIVLPSR